MTNLNDLAEDERDVYFFVKPDKSRTEVSIPYSQFKDGDHPQKGKIIAFRQDINRSNNTVVGYIVEGIIPFNPNQRLGAMVVLRKLTRDEVKNLTKTDLHIL